MKANRLTFYALLLLAEACAPRTPSVPVHEEDGEPQIFHLVLSAVGKERGATRRALGMPQREMVARLGPYHLEGEARVSAEFPLGARGSGWQEIVTRIDLRRAGSKGYHWRKTIDTSADPRGPLGAMSHAPEGRDSVARRVAPATGREVIWDGRRLYLAQRWQRFLARDPVNPSEPERIAQRGADVAGAYLRLLWRFADFSPPRKSLYLGRAVLELRLTQRTRPFALPSQLPPARRWRRSVVAEHLSGRALVDASTGAPLLVELTARWSFSPPAAAEPRSGIPRVRAKGARRRTMLRLRQAVVALGPQPLMAPKAGDVLDVRRRRLELERQVGVGQRRPPLGSP